MINKILQLFSSKSNAETLLRKEINAFSKQIPIDFGGGSSIQKSVLMATLIAEFKLQKSVDLGVYRGRSFFPQAIAHQLFTGGTVYGVDPYSNSAAVQNDRPDLQAELDTFVQSTDFELLFNDVNKLISKRNLNKNAQLIRQKSADAILFFKDHNYKVDLVHVDGNHDTKFVMEDIQNYSDILAEKSFIVLDDISWDSVQPAFNALNKEMLHIASLVNYGNDFALFAKGWNESEIKIIEDLFHKASK